jgi:hypothetical protein
MSLQFSQKTSLCSKDRFLGIQDEQAYLHNATFCVPVTRQRLDFSKNPNTTNFRSSEKKTLKSGSNSKFFRAWISSFRHQEHGVSNQRKTFVANATRHSRQNLKSVLIWSKICSTVLLRKRCQETTPESKSANSKSNFFQILLAEYLRMIKTGIDTPNWSTSFKFRNEAFCKVFLY